MELVQHYHHTHCMFTTLSANIHCNVTDISPKRCCCSVHVYKCIFYEYAEFGACPVSRGRQAGNSLGRSPVSRRGHPHTSDSLQAPNTTSLDELRPGTQGEDATSSKYLQSQW